MKKLKIVSVASELDPYFKTGGLADVTRSLPKSLYRLGNEVIIIVPFYKRAIDRNKHKLEKIYNDVKLYIDKKKISSLCQYKDLNREISIKEKEQNKKLVDYYTGLIQFRRTTTELRHADPTDFKFQGLSETALGYVIRDRIAVYMNGDPKKSVSTELPEGQWKLIVNRDEINLNGINEISGTITIPPTSGMVLKRIN